MGRIARRPYPDDGASRARRPRTVGEHDAIVRGIAEFDRSADDVWSDDVEDLDLDKRECWAWVEAAAVHATFDPEKIVPFGDDSA